MRSCASPNVRITHMIGAITTLASSADAWPRLPGRIPFGVNPSRTRVRTSNDFCSEGCKSREIDRRTPESCRIFEKSDANFVSMFIG
jgi:hypothetical protein